ncbi:MAG TPA: patatin-like phospholipase family protein [Candidatus Acidoferrum sp.]|nr:patatin-like phospholipase family protein [Candidatus Acidoferrum sp.]
MPNEEAKSIKVLSIDGGGIRGIIPAIILDALQQRVGKEPWQTFDLIAGTSTGGIITVGIGTACNNGKPYSSQELVGMYVKNGQTIFKKSFFEAEKEILFPKYSPDGLQTVLERFFGDTQFDTAFTPLLVSSYDLQTQMPFFFKSHKISKDSSYNWPIQQIARATSAAPTFFPPFHLVRDGQDYALVDGGVFVNNPAMAAYVEARRLYPDVKNVVVVSVGTGDRKDNITYAQAKDWGLLGWAKRIVPVLMDSVSEAVDYELGSMPECTYYRLQVPNLLQDAADMDNVTPENIANLQQIAKDYLADPSTAALLQTISAALQSGRGSDMPGIGPKGREATA